MLACWAWLRLAVLVRRAELALAKAIERVDLALPGCRKAGAEHALREAQITRARHIMGCAKCKARERAAARAALLA